MLLLSTCHRAAELCHKQASISTIVWLPRPPWLPGEVPLHVRLHARCENTQPLTLWKGPKGIPGKRMGKNTLKIPLGWKLLHIKIVLIFVMLSIASCYIKSIQSDFNDAMECINWGPCNLYFWVCTNRARHLRSLHHDCVSSQAESLQLRSCNTRKRYIK